VSLLQLDKVDTYYGQIHILQALSIRIEPGELVCPIFRLGLRTRERNRPGTVILVQLAGVSRQKSRPGITAQESSERSIMSRLA